VVAIKATTQEAALKTNERLYNKKVSQQPLVK